MRKKSKDKVVSWDSHLDHKYGIHGTASRSEFEVKAQTFILGELLKEESKYDTAGNGRKNRDQKKLHLTN